MNTGKFKLGQVVKMTYLPWVVGHSNPASKYYIVIGYDADRVDFMPCFECDSKLISRYTAAAFEPSNLNDYIKVCSVFKKMEPDIIIKTDFKKYVVAEFNSHDKITVKASASCHDDDEFDLQLGVNKAIERLMKSVSAYGEFKELNDWFHKLDSEKQTCLIGGGFRPDFGDIVAYYDNRIDAIKGDKFKTVYELYIDKDYKQYVLKRNENEKSRGFIYGDIISTMDPSKFGDYTRFVNHIFTKSLPTSKLDAWWSSLTDAQKEYAMAMRKS